MRAAINWCCAVAILWCAACSKPCPKVPTPPPQVTVIRPPSCTLPDLPGPIAPVIGWPEPDRVMVSKTDFILIIDYVQGMRDWIEVAAGCLTARGQ